MAAIKTIDFLPEIFRTDANKKFLNATLDQLVSEPNFKRINGYVGRKFAPTFKSTDSYVVEDDNIRQNYQLEPSVVLVDPTTPSTIQSYSNYPDLINKIKYFGGNVDNHSRLFENEMYSYDGKFDFDKFVNFSQYYWLPNGPDSVLVAASDVPLEKTFDVNLNSETGQYYFSDSTKNIGDGTITLARGGTYTFNLVNTTDPFWIQSAQSSTGVDPSRTNISVRNVVGVQNNGASSGTVTFNVPLADSQSLYTNMPLIASVDYATNLSYRELQGTPEADINGILGGLDGNVGSTQGKKIIFINPQKIDDYYWTNTGDSTVVANSDRTKTWLINVVGGIINLTPVEAVNVNEQVYIRSGVFNATKTYYVDYHSVYQEVPNITSALDTLYYQNGNVSTATGAFKIVDPVDIKLDPLNEIVGKVSYTSPADITFTNGLKVTFDSSAINGYANNTYYVEGVGKSIKLIPVVDLIPTESWAKSSVVVAGSGYQVNDILYAVGGYGTSAKLFVNSVDINGAITSFSVIDSGNYSTLPVNPVSVTGGHGNAATFNLELQPTTKDYTTIRRDSVDINAWSRSNRWFHVDVIKKTAEYNNADFIVDQKDIAIRPIIEMEPNIKLFNHGSVAKAPIDILDTVVTSASTQIENVSSPSPFVFSVTNGTNTVVFHDGDRVIFSNDVNIRTRNKIYTFNIVNVSETSTPTYVCVITETGETISAGNNVLAKRNQTNKEYHYDGTRWIASQQKTAVNQPPRFDIFDDNDVSYGDVSSYVNSSFNGTTIFEYKIGTGVNDTELGFPLSYRTFNNVGDIQFNNSYDTDYFTYLVSPQTVTQAVNYGFLHVTKDLSTFDYSNIWTNVVEKSKQYQLISHIADGVNNLFEIDILPNPTKTIPNIKVYVNNTFLGVNDFGLSQIGARYAVLINPTLLTAGDSIDILIYSDSVSSMGYYQIPPSLDNNAENITFESLTLGQIRNHLNTLSRNSTEVSGVVPGNSNIRDITIKQQGGSIVKHSASTIYSQLGLMDETLNLVDSIKLAQKEYSKFKNKFLEIASQLHLESDFDVADVTDTILKTINGIKNVNFPWYYSDMVPYGDDKVTLPPYTVLDPRIRAYELSAIFDDTTLSNKAVLIYLTRTANGVTTKHLLAKDKDYSFSKTNPSFSISDTFNLNYGDILTVVEYSNTDGNYIPETPTKLGLHQKFVPTKYIDDTYLTPTMVIQGHDGSIVPSFNDYRDDLLLELELRIYDNIKMDYVFDTMFQFMPGKFRVTDYSLAEFNQVLTNNFLTWIGNNRLDYSTNTIFDPSNPWTYNYKNFKDSINAEYLPGTWRAVFKWLYDTDRPHTHPWEMLGFSDKPDWWQDRYGPAPYTGGNINLWSDLSIGYIHAGTRAGIDSRYARPGLLQIIPVDDSGNLISPDKFAVINLNVGKANSSYSIGNQGPVEAAWRRSSDYPYALQMAFALMKPGMYFGLFDESSAYRLNPKVGQYLTVSDNQHLKVTNVPLNGFNDGSGNILRAAGVVNWMIDYVTNQGIIQSREYIYQLLSFLSVKLSYKVSGFTDKNYLKVLAEQGSPSSTNDSIIIPDENYNIFMNKSIPVDRIVYSGVIIEKTNGGFTVSGYALNSPYFTIVPSLANNNSYTIASGKLTGVIYKDYQKVLVKIPYGYEFSSTQQVVDFLIGYQRYLQSRGFVFTDTDPTLGTQKDWVLSATEFLTWAQQGWKTGNVLVLSPVNDKLSVSTTNSVVDMVNGTFNNSKLLDPNFAHIKSSAYTVLREDNDFSVTTIKGQTICLAELDLVQYEHVMVFDNKTVFNDIIYSPDTGNRQYRLKIIGYKTSDWTGALNPAGFVYNSESVDVWSSGIDYRKGQLVIYKNIYYTALDNIPASDTFVQNLWKQINKNQIKTGLLSNFAHNAQMFEDIYDVDNPTPSENLNFYSSGLTGFRERSYLTDLGIDIDTQTKFYQGYIKQKGTKDSITALSQARLANINSEINIYEEWALRVGEYGATDSNHFIEVELDESQITANPMAIQFVDNASLAVGGALAYTPSNYYKSNVAETELFAEYEDSADKPSLPSAGYVNVNDIDSTIFDLTNYRDLTGILSNIGTGYKIWTAKDFSGQWNVFRVSETEVNVVSLSYNIDNVATFTTNVPHSFTQGDVLAVKGFNTTYDGFYQVYNVLDTQTFNVVLSNNFQTLRDAGILYGNGILFKLTSSRISHPHQVDDIAPAFGWLNNDKVWVDDIDGKSNWGVYNKTSPWDYKRKVQMNPSEYQIDSNFGSSIKVSADGKFMYVGASGGNRAAVFVKVNKTWIENSSIVDTTWIQNGSLSIGPINSDEFGFDVSTNDKTFAISAPGSNSDQGHVFLYALDMQYGLTISQVLTAPSPSLTGRFGQSISTSDNGEWLYVGEPGGDKVYVYTWVEVGAVDTQTILTGTSSTTLTHTVNASSDILVTGSHPYVPGIDFNVTGGNTITFTSPLVEKVVITYHSYYKLQTVLNGQVGSNFGTSVKTNPSGRQLVIGAKLYNDGNGASYVFDRAVEKFIAHGSSNTFTPLTTIGTTFKVLIDGIVTTDFTLFNNSISFTNVPFSGSIIEVETNEFQLIQRLSSSTPSPLQNMGYAVDICSNTCSIYASAPNYRTPNYTSGAVYRFINQGKLFGTMISSKQYPTVTIGDSIRINGVAVAFIGGTTIDSIVASINTAAISGISATNYNGYLRIDSSDITPLNKLEVLPNTGTAFVDIGLTPFVQTQIITHPSHSGTELFGTTIRISDDALSLAVGSYGASTTEDTTFDNTMTTFDVTSTRFREHISNSGAVYVYNLMSNPYETASTPSQMAFVQELLPPALGANFNFGASLDFRNGSIFVGATFDNELVEGGGCVFEFSNSTTSDGWSLTNYKTPQADYESLSKAYIYNKKTQKILAHLDVYDPIHGKILGVANQDLDFKSEQDPAIYNNGFLNYNPLYHWTNKQVGKTWWDIGSMRFIDYNQNELAYKNKHWGDVLDGSSIKVYEWVESSVLPSQYVASGGNGIPKFTDDSNYVNYTYVDPSTGVIKNNYYFWVNGKTTVDVLATRRTNSILSIQQIIQNPKDQGIPYISLLAKNAIGLYNVNSYLSSTDVVLHLGYNRAGTSNIIHSEYELLKEGSNSTNIPDRIVSKVQDSLAGVDSGGLLVPDPHLVDSEKYGISIRPRQSMFVDRLTALANFTKYVNSVFILYPMADQFDISKLNQGEPFPVETTAWDAKVASKSELSYININFISNGYLVLVESDADHDGLWVIYKWDANSSEWNVSRIQSYLTSLYYTPTDWYASDFDYTMAPDYTVNTYVDVKKLSLGVGDIVKVNDNGDARFAYYRVNDSLTLDIVGSQNGTIQLSSALYDLTKNNMGFDNDSFDTIRFDQTPSIETRYIFSAIHEDLLIKDLRVEFNNAFFGLVNYIFTEQISPDWIFKTSFISVLHRIRELAQYPSYIKDNQTFYEDYINEVKPYRTIIREYVPSQSGIDYLHAGSTDFDLPAYYDTVTGTYRQPSGEFATDANLLLTSEYLDWTNNHKYKITGINITNAGTGFTFDPNVIISGGGGTGATAYATISNGGIDSIVITNPGTGYTSTPSIMVNGNGTGAILTPVLRNEYYNSDNSKSYNTIRNISSTIKFDRVSYNSDVVEWEPNTAYVGTITSGIGDGNVWLSSGTLVSYNNEIYLPQNADVITETTFDGDLYEKINAGNVLIDTNDRIMGYYQPTTGMAGKDLSQLVYGISYPGTAIYGNTYIGTDIDTIVSGSYIDSALGTRPEDINIDGGAYYDEYSSHAPEELLPGIAFDTLDMKVFTANTTSIDISKFFISRILVRDGGLGYDYDTCVVTADGMVGADLQPVIAANGAITSITIVNAGSANVPQNPDIVITGANILQANAMAYLSQDYYDVIGYRTFQNMNEEVTYSRISGAQTTFLAEDLLLTDSNIHVTNASILPLPSPELANPGVIFINGEKITYYTIDVVNNVLGQIRRAVDGTGAPSIHAAGSRVVDSSSQQVMGGNVSTETWLNMTANVADGTGLAGSTTSEAIFLKSGLSYIP